MADSQYITAESNNISYSEMSVNISATTKSRMLELLIQM